MSQAPVPGAETTRQHYKYDAWNRLVEVRADSTGTPGTPGAIVATYRHDAAGRRIRKLLGTNPDNPTTALDYYHNSGGQIIEVRKGEDTDPLEQYVWSPRYVHAPIVRWRDGNTDGDLEGEGDSTLYYCTDANFNVTALVDTGGTVVERVLYDPYGKPTFYDGSWANPSSTSAYSNEVLFTGHRLDPESGLYYTLWRHYHPTLGNWTGRDPKGYVDGMGLYEYVGGSPLGRLDAMGLDGSETFNVAEQGYVYKPTKGGAAVISEVKVVTSDAGQQFIDVTLRKGPGYNKTPATEHKSTFQENITGAKPGLDEKGNLKYQPDQDSCQVVVATRDASGKTAANSNAVQSPTPADREVAARWEGGPDSLRPVFPTADGKQGAFPIADGTREAKVTLVYTDITGGKTDTPAVIGAFDITSKDGKTWNVSASAKALGVQGEEPVKDMLKTRSDGAYTIEKRDNTKIIDKQSGHRRYSDTGYEVVPVPPGK